MKPITTKLIIAFFLLTSLQSIASDSTRYFEQSLLELQAMLEGKQTPNFERAVYLSEAPYLGNFYTYEQFQLMIDVHHSRVRLLTEYNNQSDSLDFDVKVKSNGRFHIDDLYYLPDEKKQLYEYALKNWAIFNYITDTTAFYSLIHYPYTYAATDPFGFDDWRTTQVVNLITSQKQSGNCYALTAFYKILADRLQTEARVCTAPQHIYIQHKDDNGQWYNVELATAGFPSDGDLLTLTNSPAESIRSGITLRTYTDRQLIGLNIINLAKSFERKYNTKSHGFLLKCAEMVLQNDPKNFNALLLKQQVLDEQITAYCQENDLHTLEQIQQDKELAVKFDVLNKHLAFLYSLHYRPMPVAMQKMVLNGLNNEEVYSYYIKDKNPSPFTSFQPLDKEDGEYISLSGGLFKEVHEENDFERFGHFEFDTKKMTISAFLTDEFEQNIIDPVAFAYNFGARIYDPRIGRWLSTDPSEARYAGWSPYNFAMNNPVLHIDPDGKDSRVSITRNENGGGTITISTVAHVYGEGAETMAEYNNNLLANLNTSSTVEIDGEVWTVNFDVKFKANENLNSLDPQKKGLSYSDAKNVKGVKAGDNFVCADCPLSSSKHVEEASGGGSRTKAPHGDYTALHGVFHNLGFKDDYQNEGDVMARTIPNKIDQKHFESAAKSILGDKTMVNPELDNGEVQVNSESNFEGKENFRFSREVQDMD